MHWFGTMTDVDDQKRLEEALRERLDELQAIYDHAPVGLCLLDRELRWVRINARLAEINGVPVEQHIGRRVREVLPNLADEVEPILQRILDTGEPVLGIELSGETPAAPGVERTWVENWFPQRDQEGRVVGINVVAEEITARKRAEEQLRTQAERLEAQVAERTHDLADLNARLLAENRDRLHAEQSLRESQQRFAAIFNQTFQFVGLLAPDGTLLEANQTALDFGGICREAVVGRKFWEAHWWTISPATQTQLQEAVAAAARGTFVRYEVEVLGKDGATAFIDFSLKPMLDEAGKVVLLIPEGRDITERIRAEEAMRTALAEKEVLLREVHHRVKNNLQVVVSLLRMKARRLSDPEAISALEESRDRVLAMAFAHDNLYRSTSLGGVHARTYLQSLAANVRTFHGDDSDRVRLELEVEDLTLDLDTAVPLGLITNELVTNSFKHAFPERREGRVRVALRAEGQGLCRLSVEDDGIGLPLGPVQNKTLGLKLVYALAGQLEGNIESTNVDGTHIAVIFPLVAKQHVNGS